MVLLPLLLDRGIRRLDAIALSHPDPDHCGGFPAVLEHLAVRELWLSRRHLGHPCTDTLITRAEAAGTLVIFVESVEVLRRSGIELRPIVPRLRFKRSPSNNSSVVYHVTMGDRSILLTGDIEKDAERLLSEEEADRIRADVLKVAHHGSQSSSTALFLDAVGPRMAVISCGLNNRFGHPHPSVVERLLERTPLVTSTHRSGSLKLQIVNSTIRVSREIDTPR
jgi:competence protein ComEC